MLTTDTANTAYKKRKTWTSLRLHHHCCFSHNFPLFASLEALVCPGIQKCVAAHHTSRVKARELLENSQSFCFNSPNAVLFQQAWHVLEDQPNVTTAFLVRGNLYTTTTAQSKTTAKLFWFSNLHVRHRRTPLLWLYSLTESTIMKAKITSDMNHLQILGTPNSRRLSAWSICCSSSAQRSWWQQSQ